MLIIFPDFEHLSAQKSVNWHSCLVLQQLHKFHYFVGLVFNGMKITTF